MDYQAIKTLHISCAVLSISGFSARGLLRFYAPEQLQRRWLRTLPHVIDTLLLASAIYLAWASQQYPLQSPWLTAKLAALFLYIGLGLVVMRFARNEQQRWTAFVLALLSFGYMVAVAITRQVFPWG